MGIEPRFNPADVAQAFDLLLEYIDTATVAALKHVGEAAVKYAREIPDPDNGGNGFKDHTGNLRSSIGYAIYYNGRQIESAYGDKPEGASQGQKLADQAAKGTRGYALVVTAGMYYAVYVESKGRDVLTSAEQKAADWLNEHLELIKKKVIEMWKEI